MMQIFILLYYYHYHYHYYYSKVSFLLKRLLELLTLCLRVLSFLFHRQRSSFSDRSLTISLQKLTASGVDWKRVMTVVQRRFFAVNIIIIIITIIRFGNVIT